jgi:hypothetical protein
MISFYFQNRDIIVRETTFLGICYSLHTLESGIADGYLQHTSSVMRKRLHRACKSSRRIGLVWNSLAPALKALAFRWRVRSQRNNGQTYSITSQVSMAS